MFATSQFVFLYMLYNNQGDCMDHILVGKAEVLHGSVFFYYYFET